MTKEEKKKYYRHGGPYDRGRADSYYQRPVCPHYYNGKTRIEMSDMTEKEIKEYRVGYKENSENGDFKQY